MTATRKIIHTDMDAFFAAIEQRDHPEYRGRPLIVGGDPDKRGVVSTASYEARAFGVRSAMPAAMARRLCPHGIFIRPRMDAYVAESRRIMRVFHQFTDLVEPVSIDEAYLDVTTNKAGLEHASQVARAVKRDIRDATGLTASAGVAPNKFIAKLASDMDKPDGLTVVPPEAVAELLRDLPVRKVPGIGPVTAERMERMGMGTVGELARAPLHELVVHFGKAGNWYHALARGRDDRPVETSRVRKSIGAETTFERDLSHPSDMADALNRLAQRVAQRMVRADVCGRTVTLKVTYADFTKATRSVSLEGYFQEPAVLFDQARALLESTEAGERPVRLLGISVSNLDTDEEATDTPGNGPEQLLFPFMGLGAVLAIPLVL